MMRERSTLENVSITEHELFFAVCRNRSVREIRKTLVSQALQALRLGNESSPQSWRDIAFADNLCKAGDRTGATRNAHVGMLPSLVQRVWNDAQSD
jgi:hypothetical protein